MGTIRDLDQFASHTIPGNVAKKNLGPLSVWGACDNEWVNLIGSFWLPSLRKAKFYRLPVEVPLPLPPQPPLSPLYLIRTLEER